MMTELLTTLVSSLFGGGAVAVATAITNRRANKRIATAEADKASLAYKDEEVKAMHEQIMFKDERIKSLNQEIAEKEERFLSQTNRLRECQDREFEARTKVHELQNENTRLQLELKDHRCVLLDCLKRKPQNEHTRKAIAEAKANTSCASDSEGRKAKAKAKTKKPTAPTEGASL